MRYETAGDWQIDKDGNISISAAYCGDWRMEALIMVHELVEAILCKSRGITTEQVDNFDLAHEEQIQAGTITGEPGDRQDCPYVAEHKYASLIERDLADQLSIDWETYTKTVNNL